MPLRAVILSYDFGGTATRDSEGFRWKLARDGYTPQDSFLVLSWSTKRETIRLSDHITVESLPAVFGRLRFVYDFLFVFVGPFVVWQRKFRPDRIVIADWPLAWGARAIKMVAGGEIVLRLNGLPRHIARTRSTLHYFYTVVNEVLAWWIPDRCIAINEVTARYALQRGMPLERISILAPDTIRADSEYIQASMKGVVRQELGIPEGIPIVLSIGRLAAEKAFEELIHIFAESKLDARLVIVGEGPLRNQLEKTAVEKVPGKVIFTGKKKRKDIWNYYRDANAFVLLSTSEGLGLVLWEAMYMKVPVIGRPVGGIAESIGKDGKRGFSWDTKNGAEAFRDALLRCFKRDLGVESMIEHAHQYVEARIEEMSSERPY